MRRLTVLICFAVLFLIVPANVLSGVVIDDAIALKGQKIMLRAETRGRLFSKGGALVAFFVDSKSIGKNLSGGDGVAFKRFIPTKAGLHQIRVRSDGDEDAGLLLSLEKETSIVFVEVADSLSEGLFWEKPRHGSQKTIKEIHKRFPVVFLQTGLFSAKNMKVWLMGNAFPDIPVVPWREGNVLDEIAEKGLKIKALIAGPGVIESASEHKPLAFSFDLVEDAEKVKNWDEICKKLK